MSEPDAIDARYKFIAIALLDVLRFANQQTWLRPAQRDRFVGRLIERFGDNPVSDIASAKAAFRDLVTTVYQREEAYRSVIDGITDWLKWDLAKSERMLAHPKTVGVLSAAYASDCGTLQAALVELDRLKTSALSTLGSLPPRETP